VEDIAELKRLRSENAELRMERDVLIGGVGWWAGLRRGRLIGGVGWWAGLRRGRLVMSSPVEVLLETGAVGVSGPPPTTWYRRVQSWFKPACRVTSTP